MTIVKFTQHTGYTYYYTDWDGDMSGEYVSFYKIAKEIKKWTA